MNNKNNNFEKSTIEQNKLKDISGGAASTTELKYQIEGGCRESILCNGICVRVCLMQAIQKDDDGLLWINAKKCNGCRKCKNVCPEKKITPLYI
jgi:Fe-S-cluster-containing hydrogenase component 2